ncbi:putative E3 ubiquitin-protein ligase XBAT31 [Diospyros lotus]|uniref:putative E3 ubiquitin-protein ligase XBAT31 n=1 Tax=Diospyros lotus TaxID=55363 RepID=UPI0022532374|nr:putative E3 ubiquitin-protein ligase XBAT31 [Diospyros lotus]
MAEISFEDLIEVGANILMFDSSHGRTCLHYAAYYGHFDCLQAILSASCSSRIVASWGYAQFVNIIDDKGATPLHLAARQRRSECIHILLDNGGLVCASIGCYGFPGSTLLHLAARGGSLDCICELLAWGANRLQRLCLYNSNILLMSINGSVSGHEKCAPRKTKAASAFAQMHYWASTPLAGGDSIAGRPAAFHLSRRRTLSSAKGDLPGNSSAQYFNIIHHHSNITRVIA